MHQTAPLSPVSRRKFAIQAESLDIKEDTEECIGAAVHPVLNRNVVLMAFVRFRSRKRLQSRYFSHPQIRIQRTTPSQLSC